MPYKLVLRPDFLKEEELWLDDFKKLASTDSEYCKYVRDRLEDFSRNTYNSIEGLRRVLRRYLRQLSLQLEIEDVIIFTVDFPALGKIPLAYIKEADN